MQYVGQAIISLLTTLSITEQTLFDGVMTLKKKEGGSSKTGNEHPSILNLSANEQRTVQLFLHEGRTVLARFLHVRRTVLVRFLHVGRTVLARFLHVWRTVRALRGGGKH